MADSAAGSAGDLVLGEAGKESSAAGTGEWFDADDWFFCRALLMSLYFSDKQTGDRPKSPLPAANVDPIPLESLQQEVEKPVEGSTTVAQEILGYHSTLAVTGFL